MEMQGSTDDEAREKQKTRSSQVLMSSLTSSFTIHTKGSQCEIWLVCDVLGVEIGLLDCDILTHHKRFDSLYLHCHGDHKLLYYNVVIQCSMELLLLGTTMHYYYKRFSTKIISTTQLYGI